MGESLGCDAARTRSFMVLSNEALNPKAVFNACADTPTQASEFFLLLPTLASNNDFEPRVVHMTAWDDAAGEYRRFATSPRPDGGMSINVQPSYCLNCHAGPRKLGTWQPLMNEMTNPWSQWNAEPGFRSHVFDGYLPADSAAGAVFADVSADGLLDSASNFEPIFRAGLDRVTGARMQTRHNAANLTEALKLLQPLFCDEQVNYVSEIHQSGEIRSSAVIDDALRELLKSMEAGDALPFVSEDTLRIAPVTNGEANATLVVVRGESSLQSELALVSRQVLTPLQALQVRSLDWGRPVGSEFRCALFDDAAERIHAGALSVPVSALPADATNTDLLPMVLREVMTLQHGEDRILLIPNGTEVYSIANASLVNFAELGERSRSPEEFGLEVQEALDGITRLELDQARRDRACEAAGLYLIAPLFPDIGC